MYLTFKGGYNIGRFFAAFIRARQLAPMIFRDAKRLIVGTCLENKHRMQDREKNGFYFFYFFSFEALRLLREG